MKNLKINIIVKRNSREIVEKVADFIENLTGASYRFDFAKNTMSSYAEYETQNEYLEVRISDHSKKNWSNKVRVYKGSKIEEHDLPEFNLHCFECEGLLAGYEAIRRIHNQYNIIAD